MHYTNMSPTMSTNQPGTGMCFMCLSGINHINNSSSNREIAFLMCQILEVPHLARKSMLDKFGNFTFCDPCVKRISKVENLLEDLEKLEMEVLQEKYKIESQFKENSKSSPSSFVNGSGDFCKTELRTEIVQELESNSIQSMLGKIRKKQVGRNLNTQRVRIMKNISISNMQMTEQVQLQFANNADLLNNENEDFVNHNKDTKICQSNKSDSELRNKYLGDRNVENDTYPLIQVNIPDNLDYQEPMYSNSAPILFFDDMKIDIADPPDIPINSGKDLLKVANSHELGFVLQYNNVAEVSTFQSSELKPNVYGNLPNNMFQRSNTEVDDFGNVEIQGGSPPDQSQKIEKRFICGTCGTTFKHHNLLVEHCRTHEILKSHHQHPSKRRYKCKLCEETFSCSTKSHECTHTVEKPHNCKFCEKAFYTSSATKDHERTHTGEKPYNCKFCEKAFCASKTAKTHERIHTGEKPYNCKYCEKAFRTLSAIKGHERTHTGEKPYNCKYCEKAFCTSSNAREHERTHTGEKPHSCKFCAKIFCNKSYAKKHERTHTGDKPFKCKYCEKAFSQSANAKSHERTHMGETI